MESAFYFIPQTGVVSFTAPKAPVCPLWRVFYLADTLQLVAQDFSFGFELGLVG